MATDLQSKTAAHPVDVTRSSKPDWSAWADAWLAAGVFLWLAAFYGLTTSANMQITSDEGVNLALTESIAKWGRFDVEQMATLTREVSAEHGLDGLHYSKYGLTQALLSVPLYRLAQSLETVGIVHTMLLFNCLVTAAVGAVVYLIARQLGYGPGLSLGLALIYGVLSPAWVYTKRYMSEPVTSLALAGSLLFVLRAERGGWHWPLLGGAVFGLGVLNKAANLAFAPLLMAYLLLAGGPGGGWRRAVTWWPGWRRAVAFGVPVALAAAAFAYYNWVRFGNPLHTGYGPHEGFNVPVWEGLAGLLLSPGKSAFLYFPLLLLLPFWGYVFWRRRPGPGLLLAGLVAGHVLLYSNWWIWWGGWNWGVRFLVPAWAFAVLLLAERLRDVARAPGRFPLALLACAGLGAASLAAQVLGVLVDHSFFLASLLPLSVDPDRLTLVDPRYQPVLNQLAFLEPRYLDFGWMRADRQPPCDVDSLVALGLGVLAAALALVATYRARRHPWLGAAAVLVALGLVIDGTYTYLERLYAQEDRSARQLVAHLREHSAERSTLVYLAPRYTHLYANAATFAIPTFGTYEEQPLKPSTAARLQGMVEEYDEVWLVSEYGPGDPGNGIERWLTARVFKQSETWFGPFRLASFATGRAGEPGFVALDAQLGEGIRLVGYHLDRVDEPRRPGDTINLTLRWLAEAPVGEDYTVFVQLLGDDNRLWGQRDSYPGAGFAPTSGWRTGQVVDDRYGLPVDAAAPPGAYRLQVGMYLLSTGTRLPVLSETGEVIDDRVLLPSLVHVSP